MGKGSSKSSRKGAGRGRRSNYAPKPTDVGLRRFLPVSWQHWFGATLFTLVALALAADMLVAIGTGRGADPIAAAGVLLLTFYVVYRFAVTRVTDNPEGSGPA